MDRWLPLPAPLPRGWPLALLAPIATAFLLVGAPGRFPGDPALPYGPVTLNLHWQLHNRGFASLLADDLHGFPLRTDRVVTEGVPLDAFASWPFTAALGEPLGMWAWMIVVFAALGAAAAWLGMRWWGTLGAGLVTGLTFPVAEGLLREVGEGRPTQAFAAIFLPLALGFALDGRRPRSALLAGLCVGLGTVASWSLAPILALTLVPLLLSGGGGSAPATPPGSPRRPDGTANLENAQASPRSPSPEARHTPADAAAPSSGASERPPTRPGAAPAGLPSLAVLSRALLALSAMLVPLAPVLAWTWAGRGELPSFDLDPWGEAVLGATQARPVDLAASRIFGLAGVAVGTLARPVLLLTAVAAARRAPLRTWAVPVVFAAGCAILGLGASLPGPVVAPWGWLQALPGLSRMWWADRAWIGVGLALALLAAGVPGRAKPLLAVLMVAEAFTGRSLPFKRIDLSPGPAAAVLALREDVPFVLLPTGEGPLRRDRLDLLDQLTHGRPMANGTRAVDDLRSSDAVRRGWSENPGLRALLACEMGGGAADADRSAASGALLRAGLREVYVDPSYVAGDPAYGACVEGVLAGWERGEEPPLWRYRAR